MRKIYILTFIFCIIFSCTRKTKIKNVELVRVDELIEKGIYIYQGRFGISGNYVDIYLSESCDGPYKDDIKFISQIYIETTEDKSTIFWDKIENLTSIREEQLNSKGINLKERTIDMKLPKRTKKPDAQIEVINGFNKNIIDFCDIKS